MGLSKDVLKPVLEAHHPIDMFFHDSQHTYENMMFEYTMAWRYIRAGGYLVSDNIEWNDAFDEFVEKIKARYLKLYSLGLVRKI